MQTGKWVGGNGRKTRGIIRSCLPPAYLVKIGRGVASSKLLILLVHPARFERATFAFGGQHSIQLSYGCLRLHLGQRRRVRNPNFRAFLSLGHRCGESIAAFSDIDRREIARWLLFRVTTA